MSDFSVPMDPSTAKPRRAVLTHTAPPSANRFDQHDDFARAEGGYSARAMLAVLNRRKFMIIVCVALLTLSSAAIAFILPRSYVAQSLVILDTRRPEIVQQPAVLQNLVSGSIADTAIVRTEVARLSSPAYAREIIERLNLLHNPVFLREEEPNIWVLRFRHALAFIENRFSSLSGGTPTSETPSEMGRAIEALSQRLTVYNDDRSYAIDLRYASRDPDFATLIVNTLAQLYQKDQLDIKLEVAYRAGGWLKDQLDVLQNKVLQSARRVAAFQEQNHIEPVLDGNLTEQRLHELSRQLLNVSDDLTRKETALTQVQDMLKAPGGAAAATQVLSSPVIQKLREQQAESAARVASLKDYYRSAYPGGDPRTKEIEQKIAAETQRIVTSLGADVNAARARQVDLQANIRQEQANLDAINSARVQLGQYQHEATANRTLYDSFLVRLQQIEADEQSLQSGVRIIPAEAPVVPSFPNKALFIGFGFFGSLFLGVLLAFVAEQFDESLRTSEDAERLTGLPTLGVVPRVRNGSQALAAIVNAPLSAYSDAINNILIALRAGERRVGHSVIALSSAVPNEGKTLIATSLARAAASTGLRTLLIDCDMRRPGVGSLFGSKKPAALEAMFNQNSSDLSQFVQVDQASGLRYLPTRRSGSNPQGILGSQWMSNLIERARIEYDLVILDTPPLLTVFDALLLSRMTDTTLLVVRWGHTASPLVVEALRLLQLHGRSSLGTILSLVDRRKYLHHRSGGYYYGKSVRARLTTNDAH